MGGLAQQNSRTPVLDAPSPEPQNVGEATEGAGEGQSGVSISMTSSWRFLRISRPDTPDADAKAA